MNNMNNTMSHIAFSQQQLICWYKAMSICLDDTDVG